MSALLAGLAGGDRRSIGDSNRFAAAALADAGIVNELMAGMAPGDPVLRMRCADALEKASARRPEILAAHKAGLLELLADDQPEVRWHVLPMLTRLPLTLPESRRVFEFAADCRDTSRIVRTACLQALADLALQYPELLGDAIRLIEARAAEGTPAMRARSRKLLPSLAKALSGEQAFAALRENP